MQGWGKGEGETGEAVCHTTPTLGATGGGVGGVEGFKWGVALCLYMVWGEQEGRYEKRESYPKTPGAICHIGMALELPRGPPQLESFEAVEWGEGRGLTRQRAVGGHGPLSHQLCVR